MRALAAQADAEAAESEALAAAARARARALEFRRQAELLEAAQRTQRKRKGLLTARSKAPGPKTSSKTSRPKPGRPKKLRTTVSRREVPMLGLTSLPTSCRRSRGGTDAGVVGPG